MVDVEGKTARTNCLTTIMLLIYSLVMANKRLSSFEKSKIRSIFTTDSMWEMVQKEADRTGWTMSQIVRLCIAEYFKNREDSASRE